MAARRTLALLLVLSASCAKSASSTATTAPSPSATREARNPDVISRTELQDPTIAGTDAMTAIRQLRPAFFRTRGPMSLSNATAGLTQISQDFGPLQPVNNLSGIDTRSLVEVRFLNAVDAQSRFGINANGGPVIVLLTSVQ
ncbi:MAG TPA: hypothetical protein VF461_08085 [Gemmatimonadaceae bacterium]